MSTQMQPDAAELSFRALMRVEGVSSGRRRKKRRRKARCVQCGRLNNLTVDHIVPQSRLQHLPEVRDHPANKQMMCPTEFEYNKPSRYGCNELKGDGPAVDYRADRRMHERLLELLEQYGVEEEVTWNPEPWNNKPVDF